MKLIDILVEELPKRGGWPDDVQCVVQSIIDGEIYCYDKPYDASGAMKKFIGVYKLTKAEDAEMRKGGLFPIITRAKYEAALAAKNDGWITWGGELASLTDIAEAKTKGGDVISGLHNLRHHNMELIAYRMNKPEEVKTEWNGVGIPPIGSMVEIIDHDGMLVYGHGENGEVIAHVEKTAVVRMSYGLGCFDAGFLKPLRTEADRRRDAVIDGIATYSGLRARDGRDLAAIEIYEAIAAGKIPGVKLDN